MFRRHLIISSALLWTLSRLPISLLNVRYLSWTQYFRSPDRGINRAIGKFIRTCSLVLRSLIVQSKYLLFMVMSLLCSQNAHILHKSIRIYHSQNSPTDYISNFNILLLLHCRTSSCIILSQINFSICPTLTFLSFFIFLMLK